MTLAPKTMSQHVQAAQDEALLRRALEALEEASDALHKGHPVRMNTQKAIAALRERLGEGAEP